MSARSGKRVAAPSDASSSRWGGDTIAWAMVGIASLAFTVGFVHVGAMPFLDGPALVLALVAAIAVVATSPAFVQRLFRWRVAWAAVAFLIWMLLSAVLSGRVASAFYGNPGNGWGWFALVAMAAIVTGATSFRRSILDVLTKIAPWVVGIQFMLEVWQWNSKPWEAGSFSNPTYLVMALGVLLPLSARIPEGASNWEKHARLVVVLLGLWGVAVSGGRVGFVAVAVWAVVALWTGALAGDLRAGIRRMMIAAMVVLAVPLGMYAYRRGGVDIAGFVPDRIARFLACWNGVLDRPLQGWGPDGFVNGAAPHVTRVLLRTTNSEFGQFGADPHNLAGWVLISGGFIGVGLFGWLCFEIVRNWRKQATTGRLESSLVWGVSLYAFQVLFAPAAMQTAGFALLALGASLAVEKSESQGVARWAPAASKAARVLVALCVVVLLGYTATRSTLRRPDRQPNPSGVETAAKVWSDPYLWYHANLAWGWAASRGEVAQEGRDLAAIERAVQLEPGSPVYATELARARAFLGRPDGEVRSAFEAAYRIFPLSPDAHAAYAEYLLAMDDELGAWRQLEVVKDVEALEVWRVMALYYDQTGDPKRAETYKRKIYEVETKIRRL